MNTDLGTGAAMKTLPPSGHSRIYPWRFELLLAALLCVFVVNIVFPENIYGGMAQAIYLPVQILAGCLVFESKRRILRLVALVAVLLIVCRVLNIFFASNIDNVLVLLYICFFGSVFLEIVRQIHTTDLVTGKIVCAAISGLLLIGYCGFYIFLAIEFHQPGSFNNLTPGVQAVNDLFYFSYVTILTVGYGDITPHTWIARNATVLVALAAYIYSWVIIASIVGEATSRKQQGGAQAAAAVTDASEQRGKRVG